MTDIFHEIEEEVRRERYALLWKKYGDYIIAAAAVVVVGVAAWQLWQRYQSNQRIEASNAYIAAAGSHDPAKAAAAFAALAKTAPGGYATVARLEEANSLYAAGREQEAAELYRVLIAKDDPLFAGVARLRLGWAEADTMSKKDMQSLLAPITDPSNPFHFMADEILAYVDYRLGDTKNSEREYQLLAKDSKTPDGIKARAAAMAAFMAAGGNRDVGTVPPPPAQPAPATEPAKTP